MKSYFLIISFLSLMGCGANKEKKIEQSGIYNVWRLLEMNNQKVVKTIQIEFNDQKLFFYGSDGCNQISGPIKEISGSQLKISDVYSTRIMCDDMSFSVKYTALLKKVVNYKIEGLHLYLLDENSKTLLVYKKTD